MKTLITTVATLTFLAWAAPAEAVEKKMKAAPTSSKTEKAPSEKVAEKPADQTKPAEKQATASKPLPYQGEVAAVDTTARTFIIKNRVGKEHTFAITEKTVITKTDGAGAGTADDVKVGEFVRGSRLKTGDAKWDALTVTIGRKETAAKGPKVAAKTESKLPPAPVAAPPENQKAN